MRKTWVWSLIQEELPCHRATKPMYHNYWASALEPRSYNYWAHVPQLLKPECPRACVLQQEKPSQWEEGWAPQLENRPPLSMLTWWLRVWSIRLELGRPGFNPWVGKILWRRKWQPTPVLLPGKSHGWRSLGGCSPWGRKESDMTEWLHFHLPRLEKACTAMKTQHSQKQITF